MLAEQGRDVFRMQRAAEKENCLSVRLQRGVCTALSSDLDSKRRIHQAVVFLSRVGALLRDDVV